MGRNYTFGDQIPFEWGAGKSLNLSNDFLKQATIGAVGYAWWQITDNHIAFTPTTRIGTRLLNALEVPGSHVYSAGPSITLVTKYGLFSLRYYEEFGAAATPSSRQLMFSIGL